MVLLKGLFDRLDLDAGRVRSEGGNHFVEPKLGVPADPEPAFAVGVPSPDAVAGRESLGKRPSYQRNLGLRDVDARTRGCGLCGRGGRAELGDGDAPSSESEDDAVWVGPKLDEAVGMTAASLVRQGQQYVLVGHPVGSVGQGDALRHAEEPVPRGVEPATAVLDAFELSAAHPNLPGDPEPAQDLGGNRRCVDPYECAEGVLRSDVAMARLAG